MHHFDFQTLKIFSSTFDISAPFPPVNAQLVTFGLVSLNLYFIIDYKTLNQLNNQVGRCDEIGHFDEIVKTLKFKVLTDNTKKLMDNKDVNFNLKVE